MLWRRLAEAYLFHAMSSFCFAFVFWVWGGDDIMCPGVVGPCVQKMPRLENLLTRNTNMECIEG